MPEMPTGFHTYHGGGQSFPVTDEDRVRLSVKGKITELGWNHTRAWQAALEAARLLRTQ